MTNMIIESNAKQVITRDDTILPNHMKTRNDKRSLIVIEHVKNSVKAHTKTKYRIIDWIVQRESVIWTIRFLTIVRFIISLNVNERDGKIVLVWTPSSSGCILLCCFLFASLINRLYYVPLRRWKRVSMCRLLMIFCTMDLMYQSMITLNFLALSRELSSVQLLLRMTIASCWFYSVMSFPFVRVLEMFKQPKYYSLISDSMRFP